MKQEEYSKDKDAENLLGLREKGALLFEPAELGYFCPICNSK